MAMGDRCYVSVVLNQQDIIKFCEVIGDEPNSVKNLNDSEWIRLAFEECNYAIEDERHAAARAGIKFYGYHFDGDSYPAALFASNGDRVLYSVMAVLLDLGGVTPFVVLNNDGTVNEQYLTSAKKTMAVYNDVKALTSQRKES
jgi:hypothetical protein